MHPLPLLTCINNNSSFGDYLFIEENQVKFIGSWAGDIISVENRIIKDKSFTEVFPNFQET